MGGYEKGVDLGRVLEGEINIKNTFYKIFRELINHKSKRKLRRNKF